MELNLETNDNALAEILDPEAAAQMQQEGYDIRFIRPLEPAFHNRLSDEWSAQTWHGSQPCSMLKGTSFEEVAEQYERHAEGDISLCNEIRQKAHEVHVQIQVQGRAEAHQVREIAESLAWDELNELALKGDDAANAEVIERAVHESGAPTPIYDELVAKHWPVAAKSLRSS